MLVVGYSNGKGFAYLRVDKRGKIKRNGSFIQIEFVRNGKRDWISVTERDLQKLITETKEHGAEADCIVSFDEDLPDA